MHSMLSKLSGEGCELAGIHCLSEEPSCRSHFACSPCREVEGLIPGEKAIEHCRQCHQDEPGVGRCSSFLPSDYKFLHVAT